MTIEPVGQQRAHTLHKGHTTQILHPFYEGLGCKGIGRLVETGCAYGDQLISKVPGAVVFTDRQVKVTSL